MKNEMTQDFDIIKVSEFDKNSVIGAAIRIIDDYVQKVIIPETYKGDGSKKYLPKTHLLMCFNNLLCRFITEIERMNNSNFPPMISTSLKEYVLKIPLENIQQPQISDFKLYKSGKIQEAFKNFTDRIHKIIPTYEGLNFENIYLTSLYRNFLNS